MRACMIVSPTREESLTHEPSLIPRISASDSWISKISSLCQMLFAVRRVCAPTLYWLKIRPVVRSNGNLRVDFSSVATYGVGMNLPSPRTNSFMCIVGVPSGAFSLTGHCKDPTRSKCSNETPAKVGVVAAISSMISDACAYDMS